MDIKEFLSSKVIDMVNLNKMKKLIEVKKDLGVEIEAECTKALMKVPPSWRVEVDGSLKAAFSYEFVSAPSSLAETKTALNDLFQIMAGNIQDSMRAGTHIHINCQMLTMKQLFNFIILYLLVEDCLSQDMGEDREGNFFCLRASDAEIINMGMEHLIKSLSLYDCPIFANENWRYGAMNCVSIYKFGTLEFRALKTPVDSFKPIEDWAELLLTMREAAKGFESPSQIVSSMSMEGHDAILDRALGKFADRVKSKKGYKELMFEAARRAQFWVYSTDWSTK